MFVWVAHLLPVFIFAYRIWFTGVAVAANSIVLAANLSQLNFVAWRSVVPSVTVCGTTLSLCSSFVLNVVLL